MSIGLIVFDFAGTTIDFGSRAPAVAFINLFAKHGVEVTEAEARVPMGLNKRDHILTMLKMPAVAARWQETHNREWTEADVDLMYVDFMPLQLDTIQTTSDLVPGLVKTLSNDCFAGIKIAGTTGYFKEALDIVAATAAEQGFRPDIALGADDVPTGRPAPWLIYQAMQQTGIYPANRVLKIGDTVADVQAGLNAGCWSVAVADSSSITGLSLEAFNSLSETQRADTVASTTVTFQDAGAHAVLESISQLPKCLGQINQQLKQGALPSPFSW